MKYNIVNYLDLVSMWYNEFLPVVASSKMGVVEDTGIIYVNSFSMEPHKRESVKFMLDRLSMLSMGFDNTIVVQEPKPVSNLELVQFLHYVENVNLGDSGHRNKILNLANRRYVASSNDIVVSHDDEIGKFMDGTFRGLSTLNVNGIRFYQSTSFPFDAWCSIAEEFFPRSSLNIHGKYEGRHIKINSTNELIGAIANRLMKEKHVDSSVSRFISRTKKSLMKELESMV